MFSGEKSAVFSVFSGQKFFRPADLGFKTPIFPLESFTSESYSFKMGYFGGPIIAFLGHTEEGACTSPFWTVCTSLSRRPCGEPTVSTQAS